MALVWLGRETDGGNSPTLWVDEATDEYVIQGFTVTDPDALTVIGTIPDDELVLRVPRRLMDHLPKEARGPDDI